jgi:hypothetical protein
MLTAGLEMRCSQGGVMACRVSLLAGEELKGIDNVITAKLKMLRVGAIQ